MVAIAIHGGAGRLHAADMEAAREREYLGALGHAVRTGHTRLQGGATAVEVVVSVIALMEDSGLYNAGRGAVVNDAGRRELDAAIMDGRTGAAGAVACVRNIRNPIHLAQCVMEQSGHVLLAGEGAEQFAHARGVTLVTADYFRAPRSGRGGSAANFRDHGTVGAVALDRAGNLAAGTSTGGTSRKHSGRVGDSPIIGAGTYAANGICAVSATGTGEYFMRLVAAHDVAALIAYRSLSVQGAVEEVLAKVGALGGEGGLIALDRDGRVAMACNTQRMYRACIDGTGVQRIGIRP
jgi:beta-aspartyl-peptidase (threonine type)